MPRRKAEPIDASTVDAPSLTRDAREAQMINLAVNLAEKQLRDGTASAQVITHYLKLGTEKERLEREKLRHETALLESKKHAIENAEHTEELYRNAIEAMREYSTRPSQIIDEDF